MFDKVRDMIGYRYFVNYSTLNTYLNMTHVMLQIYQYIKHLFKHDTLYVIDLSLILAH